MEEPVAFDDAAAEPPRVALVVPVLFEAVPAGGTFLKAERLTFGNDCWVGNEGTREPLWGFRRIPGHLPQNPWPGPLSHPHQTQSGPNRRMNALLAAI